jgi:hypothetical protein
VDTPDVARFSKAFPHSLQVHPHANWNKRVYLKSHGLPKHFCAAVRQVGAKTAIVAFLQFP